MERWVTATAPSSLPSWRPLGQESPAGRAPVRRRRDATDRAALMSCHTCRQPFEADDRVIVAVPYGDLGKRVVMGPELMIHDSCTPLRSGLRVVGRGWHGEIIDGMPPSTTSEANRHAR